MEGFGGVSQKLVALKPHLAATCRGNGLNSSEKGTLQGSVGRTAHALTLRDTGEDWRDV